MNKTEAKKALLDAGVAAKDVEKILNGTKKPGKEDQGEMVKAIIEEVGKNIKWDDVKQREIVQGFIVFMTLSKVIMDLVADGEDDARVFGNAAIDVMTAGIKLIGDGE